jgi:hypothetical protein
MPGNLDWLLAPVVAGLCKYESLKDGTLDLYDIALMNDALAIKSENDARARAAAVRK